MSASPQDRKETIEAALDDATPAELERLDELGPLDFTQPAPVPIVLQDREGRAMLLRVDEAELYENARTTHGDLDEPVDYSDELARWTVEALERLGRGRAIRILEAREGHAGASDLELAELVRRQLAAAIAKTGTDEYPTVTASAVVLHFTQTYEILEGLARRGGDVRAESLERDLFRIQGAAGAMLDVARELGADTFEGRLEVLGDWLENLAEVLGEKRLRPERTS